jgi:hypothetical protein
VRDFVDAVGQPLEVDDRVAHLSSYKSKNGNTVLKGTIVAFTEKLVQVRIDGEEIPKNLNNWKLVLIKDQTPAVTFGLRDV